MKVFPTVIKKLSHFDVNTSDEEMLNSHSPLWIFDANNAFSEVIRGLKEQPSVNFPSNFICS